MTCSLLLTYNRHYSDVIIGAMASQITSLTIVYSTVYSASDQRKHQSSASLAFVRGIHRSPANSPHKWPVTRKCFHLMTSSWHNDNVEIRFFWSGSYGYLKQWEVCRIYRFVPTQWETALLCNDVLHWLGASLESALLYIWTYMLHCMIN